jgi:hypothetical protein
MGVGVELWAVGKRFLVKHVVASHVPVLINAHFHYFLWA